MDARSRIGVLLSERRDRVIERFKKLLCAEVGGAGPWESLVGEAIAELVESAARAFAAPGEDVAAVQAPPRFVALAWNARELTRDYILLRSALYEELEQGWPDMPASAWRRVDAALDRTVRGVLTPRQGYPHAESLVRVLGHDLRSPLGAIAGSVQLLLHRDVHDARPRRVLQRIQGSVDRLDRLIGDVLDFARARFAGGVAIAPERVDLAELTRAAVAETAALHPGRVRFTSRLDTPVECDQARMSKVVSTLLRATLDQAPEATYVDLELASASDQALLTLHRDGPLPPDFVARVFDPCRRDGPEQRRAGFDLYVAREIVVAHHGRVDVESSDAAGTTFSVRIPLEGAPQAHAARGTSGRGR